MAPAPKPIVLTQRAAVAGEPAPQPFVVVGTVPASAVAPATTTTNGTVKKAATVAPATVTADATSAATQLNALIVSLRNAGIIT